MSPWLNVVCLPDLGFFALYRERYSGAIYIRYGRCRKLKKLCKGTLLRKV
ncbi:MAG: hypothetical protein GX085_04535 [Firmicutes bacterium]|nr:hypothetical protein [Bacillota bacterium]